MSRLPAIRLPHAIVRFALTGGLVAAVAFVCMTVQLTVFDVPGQLALVITYLVSTTLHFALNRHWVWRGAHGYALQITAQGRRYLCVVALSYAINALSLAWLPGLLDVPELAVYFTVTSLLAVVSYLVFRHWVFGAAGVPAAANTLPSEP
jgi:putative flippase GtrA